jgi:hypothetical protein
MDYARRFLPDPSYNSSAIQPFDGIQPSLCSFLHSAVTALRVPRLEAGSNTSTVALRVVGGDEKKTQCLGV